jgi:EmrB/QacA subfamily drug resistance transporter
MGDIAKRATVVVAGVAMFMGVMDTQIVNVALASITRDFHSTTASAQWVLTVYSLSLAVAVPTSGWLGDRWGTRRVFLLACALFTLASGLCAAAPSLITLIALRIVQGLGGGLLIPVSFAMMNRAHPPAERVAVARLQSLIMVLAPTTAPLLGGVLVTLLSWRWVFVVNVPVGLALIVFGRRRLREYRHPEPGPYDPAGLVLGGPGLALVLYAVTEGSAVGWGVDRVWVCAATGTALLAAFIVIELRRAFPLLDLHLLVRDRLLRVDTALELLRQFAFVAPLVFTALYVQESRGLSPLTSGTTTVPEALGIIVAGGYVARMYPRVGPRRLMATGFVLLTLGCGLLALLGPHTSLWLARGWTALLGLGTAFVALPLQASAYARVSERDTGHASALVNSAQRVGAAAAVAVLATVLTANAGTTLHPPASAFHPVFLTAAGVGVLGFMLCFAIHDADAAETMVTARPALAAAERSPAPQG